MTFKNIFPSSFLALFLALGACFSMVSCSDDGTEQEEVVKELVTKIYRDAALVSIEEEGGEFEGEVENLECIGIFEVKKDSSQKKGWKAVAKMTDTDYSEFFVDIKYRYVDDQVLVEVDFETAVPLNN